MDIPFLLLRLEERKVIGVCGLEPQLYLIPVVGEPRGSFVRDQNIFQIGSKLLGRVVYDAPPTCGLRVRQDSGVDTLSNPHLAPLCAGVGNTHCKVRVRRVHDLRDNVLFRYANGCVPDTLRLSTP